MKRLTVLGLILSLCSSAGCLFGSTTSPTNYTIVNPVTEIFQGTLDPQATQFYTITVGNPDPLRITLASVTDPVSGVALPTTKLKLGLGTTDGTTCTSTFETTTAAALVSQYFQVATANTYCVYVADPGTLTSTVGFAVRIIHS
jgi:hypothetical protein